MVWMVWNVFSEKNDIRFVNLIFRISGLYFLKVIRQKMPVVYIS